MKPLALPLLSLPALAQDKPSPRPLAGPREPFLKDRGAPATVPDTGVTAMTPILGVFTL